MHLSSITVSAKTDTQPTRHRGVDATPSTIVSKALLVVNQTYGGCSRSSALGVAGRRSCCGGKSNSPQGASPKMSAKFRADPILLTVAGTCH